MCQSTAEVTALKIQSSSENRYSDHAKFWGETLEPNYNICYSKDNLLSHLLSKDNNDIYPIGLG